MFLEIQKDSVCEQAKFSQTGKIVLSTPFSWIKMANNIAKLSEVDHLDFKQNLFTTPHRWEAKPQLFCTSFFDGEAHVKDCPLDGTMSTATCINKGTNELDISLNWNCSGILDRKYAISEVSDSFSSLSECFFHSFPFLFPCTLILSSPPLQTTTM